MCRARSPEDPTMKLMTKLKAEREGDRSQMGASAWFSEREGDRGPDSWV